MGQCMAPVGKKKQGAKKNGNYEENFESLRQKKDINEKNDLKISKVDFISEHKG